jgi:chromosome segregation ATPase
METPKRTAIISDGLAESSGGLAFEVKLAESPRHGIVQPPAHFLSPSAKGNQNDSGTPLTPETITEKLKRAEERRLSLEQLRATLLAAENNRPIEVIKIKDQQAEEFKKQTEEKLQKKLESAKENREKVLQAKIEKAKLPIEKGLASVQQNLAKLEEERQLLQEKINQKLETAETNRQEQLDRLMEKLNEHDKKIEAIKSQTKTEPIPTE